MPKKTVSMIEKLFDYEGIEFSMRVRPDSSDERVINEVIFRQTYRRNGLGFNVESGETWIDLGGNIGAFGMYCHLRNAVSISYEPDPQCFELLKRNLKPTKCQAIHAAVTTEQDEKVSLFSSTNPEVHSRGTLYPTPQMRKQTPVTVPNFHVSHLPKSADGLKMDIEGGEFSLLDSGKLPKVEKLVFEYHTSRDPSMENLSRRLDYLKSLYRQVNYPPEYDRLMSLGGIQKTFCDRLIHCKELK